jgi:hypothetical protein
MTNYQIIDTHTGYIVSIYATLIRARHAADELDSAYGAVRYTVRRIDTRPALPRPSAATARHVMTP